MIQVVFLPYPNPACECKSWYPPQPTSQFPSHHSPPACPAPHGPSPFSSFSTHIARTRHIAFGKSREASVRRSCKVDKEDESSATRVQLQDSLFPLLPHLENDKIPSVLPNFNLRRLSRPPQPRERRTETQQLQMSCSQTSGEFAPTRTYTLPLT